MSPDQTNDPSGERSQKTYRTAVAAGVVILIILAGWLTYYNLRTQPLVDETLRGQFVWNIVVTEPVTAAQATSSAITLRIAGVDLPAGTYPGNCEVIRGTTRSPFLTDELSGVICRDGEVGTEIGVFKENDNLVLKRGAITSAEGRGTDFVIITKEQQ